MRIPLIERRAFWWVLLCAAVLLIANGAQAGVILSNLGNSDGDGENDLSFNGGNASTRSRGAVGFTIGNVDQSGQFVFTIRANNPGSLNELGLRLVNDAGGTPTGSSIAFVSPATSTTIPGGGLGYTLSWNGTLAANTIYWLVASVESPTLSHAYSWVDRGSYTANGATFYQAQVDQFGGWNEIIGVNLSLSIDVTPVPGLHLIAQDASYSLLGEISEYDRYRKQKDQCS